MLINVRVIPRSSRNILEWEQNTLKVRLTAPPVDGAANAALIALLAERLAIPRRTITIVRGSTSRQKTVEIAGLTLAELARKLSPTE
ncbi:MAG: DUF167 domain-containing protein [Chloroflexi bacterium]|nr:MAG: DUF167 domain-containing protein [Chloroflexota bacterium]